MRGKSELNFVRNAESVRAKFPLTPVLLNERLARSAIGLSMPAMDSAAKWEDSLVIIRQASARVSCWPMVEEDELILVVHETAEVLSHQTAVCRCCIGTICSRRRYWIRTPAISKSLIVTCFEVTRSTMDWGHLVRQTMGRMSLSPEIQTPPGAVLAGIAITQICRVAWD